MGRLGKSFTSAKDERGRFTAFVVMGVLQEAQKIFNYWALNDVAVAYFILGKSLACGRPVGTDAAKAFQHILFA